MSDTSGKLDVAGWPVIQKLDEYARELPPEHRAMLYKVAYDFLAVGCSNGIFEASGVKSEQEPFLEYIGERRREAERAAKPESGS
jgi:hypothetical protein